MTGGPSRRRWLASVGAASLAAGLSRCGGDLDVVVPVDVGPIDAWQATRWRLFEGARVMVGDVVAGDVRVSG